jgi:hypothetical protein
MPRRKDQFRLVTTLWSQLSISSLVSPLNPFLRVYKFTP